MGILVRMIIVDLAKNEEVKMFCRTADRGYSKFFQELKNFFGGVDPHCVVLFDLLLDRFRQLQMQPVKRMRSFLTDRDFSQLKECQANDPEEIGLEEDDLLITVSYEQPFYEQKDVFSNVIKAKIGSVVYDVFYHIDGPYYISLYCPEGIFDIKGFGMLNPGVPDKVGIFLRELLNETGIRAGFKSVKPVSAAAPVRSFLKSDVDFFGKELSDEVLRFVDKLKIDSESLLHPPSFFVDYTRGFLTAKEANYLGKLMAVDLEERAQQFHEFKSEEKHGPSESDLSWKEYVEELVNELQKVRGNQLVVFEVM